MEKTLFSVIIPVYNAAPFIRETVDSVIGQTIGFKENIELILVDDGSKDNSGEICKEYALLYPDNVRYVRKENGGVSSARNEGLTYAKGEYVNFLDSDDIWDKDAFAQMKSFFDKYPQTMVAAARVHNFEDEDEMHALDYKFTKGTRYVDIFDKAEVFSVQSLVNSTVIRRDAIGDIRFDQRLKYGEDSVFINELILQHKGYGLVKEALYHYRHHVGSTSAIIRQKEDVSYYTDSLRLYHMELYKQSEALYGKVIPFIQALFVYDGGFRFEKPGYKKVLSEAQIEVYWKDMEKLLAPVEDEIIIHNPVQKAMIRRGSMIERKNGGSFFGDMEYDAKKTSLVYRDVTVLNLKKNNRQFCVIDTAFIKENTLHLEGRVTRWIMMATKDQGIFTIKVDGVEMQPELSTFAHETTQTEDGNMHYYARFTLDADLSKLKDSKKIAVHPGFRFGKQWAGMLYSTGKYVPDNRAWGTCYKILDGKCMEFQKDRIEIFTTSHPALTSMRYELMFWVKAVKKHWGKIALRRLMYFILKRFKRKEIWLISDRMDNAGDNGEVFYNYVKEHLPENVDAYFCIGKNAECVPRLKANKDNLLFFESKMYPYKFLLADKIISSSANEFTINWFKGMEQRNLKDLMNFKYYYLQHGVACADLSSWLNKANKNINMIFTSSPKERQGFIEAEYYYKPEQIKLTGQARFDALRHGDKKQILILPTWRRSIKQSYDAQTRSVYFDRFNETEYFKFYNNLINDERLLSVMRENGYTGLFCLHPIHKEQYVDYQANDVFKINHGFIDYNQVFEDSSLFVTDYSSVLFDFAYLRKSVIYAQFDKEEFFEGQIYDEGYFSYEEDGFGPVCYDYESTLNTLIEAVKNQCKNPQFYLDRANKFFAYSDQNNSKRILEIIENDRD